MRHPCLAVVFVLAGCAAGDLDDETDEAQAAIDGMPAVSFHIVAIADLYTWNGIRGLADVGGGPIVTSQNRPGDLAPSSWAKNISPSYYADGDEMAAAIHALLSDPAGAPALVMIDELRPEFETRIVECANRLRADHPEWRGRWGAYLVNGEAVSYPGLADGIDALLDAGAILGAEMYARQSAYCAAGSDETARDAWLGDFFHGARGEFPQGRFAWLMKRKLARQSTSTVTALFGVTDSFLDGVAPAVFLDRMFYVWGKRSGYPFLLSSAHGGIGSWKWDAPATGNTSRDAAFAASFQHYVIDERRTPRLGSVHCPQM